MAWSVTAIYIISQGGEWLKHLAKGDQYLMLSTQFVRGFFPIMDHSRQVSAPVADCANYKDQCMR